MGKQNIGTINALTRITLGLFLIVFGALKLIKRPWNQSYWMIVLLSAMKVAEGIVRYCPVTDIVTNQKQSGNKQNQDDQQQSDQKRKRESEPRI